MENLTLPVVTDPSDASAGAWQRPRRRRLRPGRPPVTGANDRFLSGWHARGFAAAPVEVELAAFPAGGADDDVDDGCGSDYEIVDAHPDAFEGSGLSYCDDRESLEEWDFVDAAAVTRLVERGLTYVQAALRGFTGEFAGTPKRRGNKPADDARETARGREARRREKKAAYRASLAADRAAVLSSDEDLAALVRVARRRTRGPRPPPRKRSKSAVRSKSKSLAKSKA